MRMFAVMLVLASGCHRATSTPSDSPGGGGASTVTPASSGAAATSIDSARAAPPGSAKIVFRFPDASGYCRTDDCAGMPPVSIRRTSSIEPLHLNPGRCAIRCADCRDEPCPKSSCSPMGVPVSDTEYVWDGRYYEASTCGTGRPCAAEKHAENGRYVAEMCVLRGARTIDSIGAPQCIENGERKCVSVEFEFPSPEPRVATF